MYGGSIVCVFATCLEAIKLKTATAIRLCLSIDASVVALSRYCCLRDTRFGGLAKELVSSQATTNSPAHL